MNRDYLYSQYHDEQKTLREIASSLGLSHCTVLRKMREYGILTNRTKGPKQKRVTVLCEYCKKPVVRVPSTKSKRNFCSYDCYHGWMVGNTEGPNSNRWEGGITEINSLKLKTPEFRKLKKIVLNIFPVCVLCGDNEKRHVHHIQTRREHPERTFDLSNLITLCNSCHSRIRGIEHEWEQYFTRIVMKANGFGFAS